jgi:hypothetical protein
MRTSSRSFVSSSKAARKLCEKIRIRVVVNGASTPDSSSDVAPSNKPKIRASTPLSTSSRLGRGSTKIVTGPSRFRESLGQLCQRIFDLITNDFVAAWQWRGLRTRIEREHRQHFATSFRLPLQVFVGQRRFVVCVRAIRLLRGHHRDERRVREIIGRPRRLRATMIARLVR